MPLQAFVTDLERLAEQAGGNSAIWNAGELMALSDLGIVGCAMAAAPTLGGALRCFVRYFGGVQSATAVGLDHDGDAVQFRYRILDENIWPRRADAALTLGVVAGLVRRYAPTADRALTAQFEDRSNSDCRDIARHLGRPLRMGEDNALTIPARLLDATQAQNCTTSAQTIAFREAVQSLDLHLHRARLTQPISSRVLDLLLVRTGHQLTDQDAIARELGMSRRTLRRQLDAEGTSFQKLNETCRRNIGHALLVRTDMPMIEIAMRLGYSDHTAFSRAFTRWFGMPPRELRKAGSGRSDIT